MPVEPAWTRLRYSAQSPLPPASPITFPSRVGCSYSSCPRNLVLATRAPLPVFLVLDFCLKLISLPGKFLVKILSLMAHQCVRTRASSS